MQSMFGSNERKLGEAINLLRTEICIPLAPFSEKAMATHSSVLAWRIPGMGEPGGLLSMGTHRAGHD